MSVSTTTAVQAACAVLSFRARKSGGNSKKAIYETRNGRALALDLHRPFIGLFAERFPGAGRIPGVTLRSNGRTPGHYGPADPRGASIKDHGRLGLGHEVFYLECADTSALEAFIDWYEKQ